MSTPDAARQDPHAPSETDPTRYWEDRYGQAPTIWSGRPNATLVRLASDLPPGDSLDLGSGEGGDVLWLAERGWRARGLEISSVAVERARRAARERGLDGAGDAGRAEFAVQDLGAWHPAPGESYDLVTASFLQSPVALDRERILRTALGTVAPGGHGLLISHAEAPFWAQDHHDHDDLPSAEEELAALAPDPQRWEVLRCTALSREATASDGRTGEVRDAVILLRRR